MSRPGDLPPALSAGILIQPNFIFNIGALVGRDLSASYYEQDYFRNAGIRRVAIVDSERRCTLLTTPMRAMSAWRARDAVDGAVAPYLSLSGWQPSIESSAAYRYLAALATARSGSLVVAAGKASIVACPADRGGTATAPVSAVDGIPITSSSSWVSLFADSLSGVDSGTAFISDSLDMSTPENLAESGSMIMLLREEESEVAMGSPMTTIPAEGGAPQQGIQFRGGYGAEWDASAPSTALKFPFYSPIHRSPTSNRVWSISS